MELYKLLFDGRDQDSQRFWTVFNLMSVINGALIALVASQNPPQSMKVIASLTGIFLCMIWFSVQRRFHGWVVWWEEKLVECEPFYLEEINKDRQKKKLSIFPDTFVIFQRRKGAVTQGMSTRVAGWLLPLGFIIAWLLILLWSSNIQISLSISTPITTPTLLSTP